MIRIDALYEQTFWPWLQQNHPSTRMFWCEPVGRTGIENLLSNSPKVKSDSYVFFHDQEPVDSIVYDDLFALVKYRNLDVITSRRRTEPGIIVVSEKGPEVAKVCAAHGWSASYYFFHGWAALDWYRGYDRSFLAHKPEHRQPTTIFHDENSHELDDGLVYVITEKIRSGERLYLTAKTFKPIAWGMPFVLLSTAGSLEYLRSYGFQSFSHLWNEDYDGETDDQARLESVTGVVKDLEALHIREKKQLWRHCLPIIKHNWNWFYGGGFEQTLWRELTDMLKLW